jgi:hypothetical protein
MYNENRATLSCRSFLVSAATHRGEWIGARSAQAVMHIMPKIAKGAVFRPKIAKSGCVSERSSLHCDRLSARTYR